MNKIQVKAILLGEEGEQRSFTGVAGMMAKLTQRGHGVKSVEDLERLYLDSLESKKLVNSVAKMGHGSVLRHLPITIAIVGASRRLLAQYRTHKVGIEWVSASLQYSDYSKDADFVVPYEILILGGDTQRGYLDKCRDDLEFYSDMIAKGISNDTAGYIMNQALRNVLVGTANHEAWMNLINRRSCKRNTEEAQYVAFRIWEALQRATDVELPIGPDCVIGSCREGSMCCGDPYTWNYRHVGKYIEERWPLCL